MTGPATAALELRESPSRSAPSSRSARAPSTLDGGSIHALVGENGAGKSTLVKIIAGLYQPRRRRFRLDGEAVDFRSTAQSKAAGIAVIYQEPTLFPDLSVTENIFMGRQPQRPRRAHRPQGDARRGERALRPARRAHRPATAPPRASRSPTSRSSRSPRPSRSTPACSSWTSRPPRSAASRSSGSSRSPAACATRAARCSSSRTASTRSSRSATPSRSCATASTSPPTPIAETTRRRARARRWSAARSRDLFPKTAGRDRRRRARGRRAHQRRRVPRHHLHGARRRDRRPRRPRRRRPQRGRPRRLRRRPATTPGTVRLDGRGAAHGQPAGRDRAGLALVPEDRRKQGLVLDELVARNVARAIRAPLAHGRPAHRRAPRTAPPARGPAGSRSRPRARQPTPAR